MRYKFAFGGQVEDEDLMKFTKSYETFHDRPYQIKDKNGNLQTLIGYGSADPALIAKGTITEEEASNAMSAKYRELRTVAEKRIPNWSNLSRDVQYALLDTMYNAGESAVINKSPKLMALLANGITDGAILAAEMDHSKSQNNWLGARSAARRAMAQGKYKWDWNQVDKFGRQIDSTKYKGPEDWRASLYFGMHQRGGLIYKPIEKYRKSPKSLVAEPEAVNDTFSSFFSNYTSSFPVEPVKVETPKTVTFQPDPEFKPEIQQVTAPTDATKVDVAMNKRYTDKNQFISDMRQLYSVELSRRGISTEYADWLVAQDALETGWGKSPIGKNNFGNIQWFQNVHGNKYGYSSGSDKHKDGTKYSAKFVDFDSIEEYIRYKVGMLSNPQSKRYRDMFNGNVDGFAERMQKSGYAESSTYASALRKVLNSLKQQ